MSTNDPRSETASMIERLGMSDAWLDAVTKCPSTKKDSYPDSDSAKAVAAILNQKPGRRLSAYQCRACDLWHIRRDRDANP